MRELILQTTSGQSRVVATGGRSRRRIDGVKITELPTPSFIIDRSRLQKNCDAMRVKAERARVTFRPHVKTHKCVEIGRIQQGGRNGAITVSTLAEARYFADAGFDDITYAVPIAPAKLSEVAGLGRSVSRINILVDHIAALRAVESFAASNGVTFDVFIKTDCGYHRAGVDPSTEEAVELGTAAAASKHVRLRGLLTHAGHSYHARSRDEILAIAHQESSAVTSFASKLADRGVEPLVRSVGSTPTLAVAGEFSGCDEVRPGNYVFFDAYQAQLGSCSFDDVAVSVLATVVGVYPAQQKVIVDAGSLAITRESGFGAVPGGGVVCDLSLRQLPLTLASMSQEHGQLAGASAADMTIGEKVRIVPNHSCITAAMFDRYYVIEGDAVVDEWRPVRGW